MGWRGFLYIATCLALFVAFMVAFGVWIARPAADGAHAWLVDALGLNGATLLIFGAIGCLGIWAYRANRSS